MFDLSRLAGSQLVAHIDYHESLGSTSDRAIALAAEGEVPLPLLVLAEHQTAGRGRGNNRWLTSSGALTFSLGLEASPHLLPPARWPLVALVAGLATCEALQEQTPTADVRLKWPNDVLLGGRKISGILSESVPGWPNRLVIGIGVNVNNTFTDPASQHHQPMARFATSLIEQDHYLRDLTTVLISILEQFDGRWPQLLYEDQQALIAAYRQRCFLTGRTVTLEQPGGKRLIGVCRGIDETGRLALHTPHGPAQIASGTVVSWEP